MNNNDNGACKGAPGVQDEPVMDIVLDMEEDDDDGLLEVNLPFIPEEVWEAILWKVKEPQDLHNCYNTCLLWRKIVKGSRTAWIFKEIFPPLFNFLPKQEILNCRLVCKYWRDAVDDSMINHECLQPFNGGHVGRYHANNGALRKWEGYFGASNLGGAFRFDGSYLREGWYSIQRDGGGPPLDEGKLKFWRKWDGMIDHPGNPMIGSSIHLTVWDSCLYNQDGILKDKAATMVTQLGKYLLNMRTYSQSYGPSSGALYKFLCFCLEHCPGLRTLGLGGRYGGSLPDSVRRQDELQRLPEHPALETVELTTLFDTAGGVAHSDLILERYSRQLKRVQVGRWKGPSSKLPWPNLTELHVKSFETLPILNSLANMEAPNLRKLSLGLTFEIPSQVETLMRIINRFPGLTILKLEFGTYSSSASTATLMGLEGPGMGTELRAPGSLKLLEIGRWTRITLPFLAHFPSIQYLHLWGVDEGDVNPTMRRRDGPPWASKILRVLPSLQEVSWEKADHVDFKIKRWTREAILKECGSWAQPGI